MGGDLAKTRLDNQLDSYFGRSGNTDLESRTMITLDPLNDPSGKYSSLENMSLLNNVL
jgi:hypothetical protein